MIRLFHEYTPLRLAKRDSLPDPTDLEIVHGMDFMLKKIRNYGSIEDLGEWLEEQGKTHAEKLAIREQRKIDNYSGYRWRDLEFQHGYN